MNATQQLRQLQASAERLDIGVLQDFFDSLEALPTGFMLGEWDGGVFNTGHPGEKQLARSTGAARRFMAPIISRDADGKRVVNPVLGNATMVYDRHPIFDHFRKVDDNTVLGVMDRKGDTMPLFFFLVRL